MKISIKSLALVTALLSSLLLFTHQTAFAVCTTSNNTVKGQLQQGADCAAEQSGGGATQINTTVQNVIFILSSIAGVVAVVMIIVAGFRYITSGGNEQTIASAKKTLTYAIVGLVIAVLAQIIARFVLKQTT